MTKTLTASKAKTTFYSLLPKVASGNMEFVVTWNGEPAAVLVGVEELAQLRETIDILSDPEMMTQLRSSERFYQQGGKGNTFEDVFGEPLFLPKRKPLQKPRQQSLGKSHHKSLRAQQGS